MFLPQHFTETDSAVLQNLIRAHPLATLVTLSGDGLNANHLPLILQPNGSVATLQGHVPRANPLTRENHGEREALAVFHGPEGYISPSWYPTKQQTGKVVPTWNYAVVHVYGKLRLIDDPAWVRRQIESLTRQQETRFDQPWQVDDAPRDFTDRMISALLGIEIEITRMLGKTKASQNQPLENRVGVVDGLSALGSDSAEALAALTRNAEKSLK